MISPNDYKLAHAHSDLEDYVEQARQSLGISTEDRDIALQLGKEAVLKMAFACHLLTNGDINRTERIAQLALASMLKAYELDSKLPKKGNDHDHR